MAFSLIWEERALGELKSLERDMAGKIIERIKLHLVQQPDKLGKPLKGVLRGLYRYRMGDYRIVYTIDRKEKRISIPRIARRSGVYRVREGGDESYSE